MDRLDIVQSYKVLTFQYFNYSQGFFTMSMHCEHSCNRDDSSFLKSTYIRPDGQGNVQCACEVTNPIKNTPGHAILPSGLVYTCNLVITRCPTVIQLL